jgi:hypothetical protein
LGSNNVRRRRRWSSAKKKCGITLLQTDGKFLKQMSAASVLVCPRSTTHMARYALQSGDSISVPPTQRLHNQWDKFHVYLLALLKIFVHLDLFVGLKGSSCMVCFTSNLCILERGCNADIEGCIAPPHPRLQKNVRRSRAVTGENVMAFTLWTQGGA